MDAFCLVKPLLERCYRRLHRVADRRLHRFADRKIDIFLRQIEHPLWHDFHATVLHLLGIDHSRLSFCDDVIQRRMIRWHGDIVAEALA